MTEPRWIDVEAPAVRLRALTWGPADGPIALCLNGFPDTAYGFRKLAPLLAAAGWRVIAPFMRGYVPSSIPSDRSYHIGALMDDALQVRAACGPTDRDVVIGHDWGAIAATGLAAMPESPFAKAVVMSVPPSSALRPAGPVPDRGRLLRLLAPQLVRSWYISYFQLPRLPERSASWTAGAPRSRPPPGHHSQHPPAGPLCRPAPPADRTAPAADAVSARKRRRLHDTRFRAVGARRPAGRQRSGDRRARRAFPAVGAARNGRPADPGLHRSRCLRAG